MPFILLLGISFKKLNSKMNISFNLDRMYTKAKLASNITWPVKTDDFFPYADFPNAYWTGTPFHSLHTLSSHTLFTLYKLCCGIQLISLI